MVSRDRAKGKWGRKSSERDLCLTHHDPVGASGQGYSGPGYLGLKVSPLADFWKLFILETMKRQERNY